MQGHLAAMCAISGTYARSSGGPLSSHLGAHYPPLLLARARRPRKVDYACPQRALPTPPLKNHSVFAFLHLRRVAFPRAQNPVKHSVFCTSHAQNTVKHVGRRLFGGVRGRGRQSL